MMPVDLAEEAFFRHTPVEMRADTRYEDSPLEPWASSFTSVRRYVPARTEGTEGYTASTTGNCIILSFPKGEVSELKDERLLQTTKEQLERISYSLRLSKIALSEILGVSRQTIYDWLSGGKDSIKPENLSKIEWLNEVSSALGADLGNKIWLWRDKKLSSGHSLADTLKSAAMHPPTLAKEIRETLTKWQATKLDNNPGAERAGRRLVDKSVPFSNNE